MRKGMSERAAKSSPYNKVTTSIFISRMMQSKSNRQIMESMRLETK